MAGRIKASDIDEVKQRINIADIVADHVTLKSAGIDSLKGLCPFHDERSPSFHVRPALGYYHCFGCGESGDAIAFLQRLDHLTFVEAVERLAAKAGYSLTYEDGPAERTEGPPRSRLYAANAAAEKFFREQLESDEATVARELLTSRGFEDDAIAQFTVGYAPRSWDALTKALASAGFSQEELTHAGLVSEGNRGVYDRFRGRLIWPIRDTSGQTLGFGARKLYEDDGGPKYLNTPETAIYRKSQVLYGLDLAKKEIARSRRVVVVEGYTDVMACHLAGVTEAVATCGTAFGHDHIALLRRIMGDDAASEVVFTFDPDEAGQKAALKAFADEKLFRAQTYIAVPPDGLDPSDLRQHRGDAAVRTLFETKAPLFEFALRQAVNRFNLNTVEGRVSALREAAPIVAGLKDQALKPGYTRELAIMLGLDIGEVKQAVSALGRTDRTGRSNPSPPFHDSAPAPAQASLAGLPATPSVRLERDALAAMLQLPEAVGQDLLAQAVTAEVHEPSLRTIRDAVAAQLPSLGTSGWIDRVIASLPEAYHGLTRELSVIPMPQSKPDLLASYARGIVASLLERDLLALKAEMVARLQRLGDPQDPQYRQVQEQIVMLEQARRTLRED